MLPSPAFCIVHEGACIPLMRFVKDTADGPTEVEAIKAKVVVLRTRLGNDLYLGLLLGLDGEGCPPIMLAADAPLHFVEVWRAMKAAENLRCVRIGKADDVVTLNHLTEVIRSPGRNIRLLMDLAPDFGMKVRDLCVSLETVKSLSLWPLELFEFCALRAPL